jgi:predicted nucleic-acid-binding protein
MANFIDTNYLIRFYTQDDKNLANVATRFLKSQKDIYITTVVIAETMFILEKHYKMGKVFLCEGFETTLKQENINFEPHVPLALKLYKVENLSFYDSLIVAETIENKGKLYTFDKKMHKVFAKYSS